MKHNDGAYKHGHFALDHHLHDALGKGGYTTHLGQTAEAGEGSTNRSPLRSSCSSLHVWLVGLPVRCDSMNRRLVKRTPRIQTRKQEGGANHLPFPEDMRQPAHVGSSPVAAISSTTAAPELGEMGISPFGLERAAAAETSRAGWGCVPYRVTALSARLVCGLAQRAAITMLSWCAAGLRPWPRGKRADMWAIMGGPHVSLALLADALRATLATNETAGFGQPTHGCPSSWAGPFVWAVPHVLSLGY